MVLVNNRCCENDECAIDCCLCALLYLKNVKVYLKIEKKNGFATKQNNRFILHFFLITLQLYHTSWNFSLSRNGVLSHSSLFAIVLFLFCCCNCLNLCILFLFSNSNFDLDTGVGSVDVVCLVTSFEIWVSRIDVSQTFGVGNSIIFSSRPGLY